MNTLLTSMVRAAVFLTTSMLAASLTAQNSSPTLPPGAPPPASTVNSEKAPPKLAHQDKAFIEQASGAGMHEIAISQAVMSHLTNPPVREFANAMITDHTVANTALTSLAAIKGVKLPVPDTAKLTGKWSGLSGDVDKNYVHQMVKDHEDAVKLFEKASKSDDPDVKAFAFQMLPTLRHHLAMAKDLRKSIDAAK